MKFSEMGLETFNNTTDVEIRVPDGEATRAINLTVREYLPIDEKAQFVQFVVNNAIDNNTGCFSPIRTEVYFGIAVCRWYAGIEFDEALENVGVVYDKLEQNDIITKIASAIPGEEYNFINQLVMETCEDIARFNNSFVGMMQVASENTSSLNAEITDILEKIKNKEGMEQLAVIKDVVG